MERRSVAVLVAGLLIAGIGCGEDSDPRPAAATPTSAATPMPTPSALPPLPTATLSAPAFSPTPSAPPTATAPAATATPTPTSCEACDNPTATATPPVPTATPRGPEITYFGIARADDAVLTPTEYDDAGRPVFVPLHGQGVTIVIEARPGARPLVAAAYDPSGGPRGLDLLVSSPLGNGSPTVCDIAAPMIGGVPATDPPVFSDAPATVAAIDDLCCRVNDGTGAPDGRTAQSACTRVPPGDDYAFIDPRSNLQYCLPIAKAWSFGLGETIVAARVRDVSGAVSAPSEIVVRINPEPPFACDQGLGERDFTVGRPASRLLTSASGGEDASTDPWTADPLRICAGDDLGDGLRALALRDDAILALPLRGGGVLCAKISARGSAGSLDCTGGTAADVRAAQDAEGRAHVVVETGLGLDAGTGAATLIAPMAVLTLPPGAAPSDCQGAAYASLFTGALTSATGTAQVVALDGTVVADVAGTGSAFDCTTWRSGTGGSLVLPFPLVHPSGEGDEAVVVELSE